MSSKHKLILPSVDEDEAINAGIAADPDTYELGAPDLARMTRQVGRPAGSGSKRQLTVRFDADVIDAFKAGGDGWQTRMNDALRDWLREHGTAAERT
jgi:uncharacterized protein (DUF4415 family)